MPLPLPQSLHQFFTKDASPNASLLLDRGYDGHSNDWSDHDPVGKRDFLCRVASTVASPQIGHDYRDWLLRRTEAISQLGASPIDLTCTTALIVGVGRKNAADAGLTLDRAWGVPYIPGSSFKGLLRATADLVIAGELGDDAERTYWRDQLDRSFGSGASRESEASRGTLAWYDAYPSKTDVLELGIITPHYQGYYGDKAKPPADWYDPVPVPILQVKPGTPFRFWIPNESTLRTRITSLLRLAADWLGVGAKTSSGFGWFSPDQSIPVASPGPERGVLEHAELKYAPNTGELGIIGDTAFTRDRAVIDQIPELIARLKNRKRAFARATIEVRGNQRVIVQVETEGS